MRAPKILPGFLTLAAVSALALWANAPVAPTAEATAPTGQTSETAAGSAAPSPALDPLLWPESQRSFLQDGPGLLLTAEARATLLTLDEAARSDFIAHFLGTDPDPATPLNELAEGIERRRQLAASRYLSPLDVRSRLLFLDGEPASRVVVECGVAFRPIEIWSYSGRPGGPDAAVPGRVVVYRPADGAPYELWKPLDSKRVLYTPEMEYFLEQWEELHGRPGRRLDLQVCKQARAIDEATGVRALRDYQPDRPTASDYERFLVPPEDLAAWARAAAATPLPDVPPRLEVAGLRVVFPEVQGQRTVTRAEITLPPGAGVEPFVDPEHADTKPELRLTVDAVVEQEGRPFEETKLRYRLDPPEPGSPIALVLDRSLRPERSYLLRLRVQDETGGAEAVVTRGFTVPREPTPEADLRPAAGSVQPLDLQLAATELAGADSLIMVPPTNEVAFGLWRAEALVTGPRIVKVAFLLDGKPVLTRARRPFSAEIRLAELPTQQVVRAEGYDASGALVAADEVVLNQPRGAFAVDIVEPARGFTGTGPTAARAEVTLPEERRIEKVEFRLNNELVATLDHPPWTTEIDVPAGEEVTYLAATAYLDDGRSAEAVRFLNAPRFLAEVDVRLVELYVAVLDETGRPVLGLGQDDFEVEEDGRPQEIKKFELVDNLPLSVGIAIDTSGSMVPSIAEAQSAGKEFLERVMKPRDRCFVLGFAAAPKLLMAPTDDAAACIAGLDQLQAIGSTALHDAVATSLYYFRAVRGQRALILLSDGDDTSSTIAFPAALEYARKSGVAIYPIGLGVTALSFNVRAKLNHLAEETGGKVFFISKASDLQGVYAEIERELRSRYFIAYEASAHEGAAEGGAAAGGAAKGGGEEAGRFREVEVKMKPRGLKARTIRGYYP